MTLARAEPSTGPSRKTLAAFVAPQIPLSAVGLPLTVYLPPFYAVEMGLGLTVVGLIFVAARLWDVVLDPLVGVFSDRVRTPWGRRKPLAVASVPILLVAAWRVFLPPDGVGAAYLTTWLFTLYIGYTFLMISLYAWSAELSSEYDERTRIQGWIQFTIVLGMLLVLVFPAVAERFAVQTAADKVAAMGLFIICTLPFAVALAVWRVPEPRESTVIKTHIDFRTSWHAISRNVFLRRVLIVDLLIGFASGTSAALFVFVAAEIYGAPKYASGLLLTFFLMGCLCIPLWVRLSRRISKHRALAWSGVLTCVVLPPVLFFPTGNVALAFLSTGAYGLTCGAATFLLRAITVDVVDVDQAEVGERRSGLYFALLTLTNKVGNAVAVGLAYPTLALMGFDGGEPASAVSRWALVGLYVMVPVVCNGAAAIMFWNFGLDQRAQRRMRGEAGALA